MPDPKKKSSGSIARFWASSWLSGAILVVSMMFVAESLTLKGDAAKYPLVVGLITAALSLIDLAGRYLGRHDLNEDHIGFLTDRLGQKLLISGWLAATITSFYVLGIIATVALSGAVYFRLFVTENLFKALLIGLAHALAFWVAFDLLAGFNLYNGLFD
jgi:hypothetical protein